jgi:hypothetical protein
MSLALDGFRNNGLLPFCEEHERETLAIYASLRRTAWEAAMEVLYVTCCGLDVHKSSITASPANLSGTDIMVTDQITSTRMFQAVRETYVVVRFTCLIIATSLR